jgi:hypothetical protein
VAAVVVLLTEPLTVSAVGWTAFWAAVAVVVVTLVERPAVAAATAGPFDAPAGAVPAGLGAGPVDTDRGPN